MAFLLYFLARKPESSFEVRDLLASVSTLFANLTSSVEGKRPSASLMMKQCRGTAALVSLFDYEEYFYHAFRDVHGPGGIIDAPSAIFEATKLHFEQLFEAGKSLQQSMAAGSESKLFLKGQVKAQEISYF